MLAKPLKVLHIITGLTEGGAESSLYQLCQNDRHNVHRVVCLMDAGQYGPRFDAGGIEVVYLKMPRGRVTFAGLWRLWRTLRELRPDVVQTWMYHANLVGGVMARLAGVKAICWGIHNSNLMPGVTKRSTIWVAKACGALSRVVPSRIVSCSQHAVEVHRKLRYAAMKFVVVPNGYNLLLLTPDAGARARVRQEWGIDDDMPLLGMVARFDPLKDHANLIAALAQLKGLGWDFRCALVGAEVDADNAELVQLLEDYGVRERVLLVGRRSDIPAVMNALDVHVLSSLSEAFPNVLSEAMACGTPCVSTDVGDAAFIVGDTGWIVPPSDPRSLADHLAMALDEYADVPAWQARKQRAHQRVVDSFSVQRMIDGYSASWHQACHV
ncbi:MULTISPECIES: glycosyltransferase family 4 protein [Chromohalobacter]|uniref:Glycosyltransferase n=1 Tax=Chromohalobacter moromii TaxID=2860329 RepID=A0A9X3AYK5_9GAMM|nr:MULTISPECIES: glycosyltransferase [Chromohalobacter]MCK2047148.1 glycosyltransferase [Chromohalobacter moromii]MCT8468088.1 glycosyltransferase [Chromohalobacter canadensis]MCT8498587.1 glycosyltransferase [Chromohalobacter canadensis]MCT8506817.1 glycosyltransferase [Chromohalobacter moromii]